MKLSIIIPCYNEEKDIRECLESLREQSCKNFEILIVDDGSTDKTLEFVENFKKKNKKFKIKILKQNHKGPGFARNLGAKKAEGEILVFVDADMAFDKDYLKNLIKPLRNKKIVGTTHELEIVNNTKSIWSRCWGKIRVSKEEAKEVKVFRAIRRDKFLMLGGFDPKYGYSDDQTLWFKYKIKPVVAPKTICYHRNPETLRGVYKQSRWIGSSQLYWWLEIPFVNFIGVLLIFLTSPLFIPLLSFKRCYKNRDFLILPFMLVFMTVRYFGNLDGYIKKIVLKENVR